MLSTHSIKHSATWNVGYEDTKTWQLASEGSQSSVGERSLKQLTIK